MKERKPAVRRLPLWVVLFLFAALSPARANEAVDQFFALSAKLQPGMSKPEMEKLLGPPAEERIIDREKSLVRSSWLHGEMGVEGYYLKGKIYRVTLSRRFEKSADAVHALDVLTRQGSVRYRSMPHFDPIQAEYYWIAGSMRFAFARDGANAVRVSSTETR